MLVITSTSVTRQQLLIALSTDVEHSKHRDEAVARSVGAADVRAGRSDVVHGEADTAGLLRHVE